MTKFKVGDKVLVSKPEKNQPGAWISDMDELHGKILTVSSVDEVAYLRMNECGWTFHPDWCEKVDNNYSEITSNSKQVPDIGETIDWEQRRYEIAKECLAAQINGVYAGNLGWSYKGEVKSAIEAADELIKQLQKTTKN